jgi:hypothetical protein
MAKQDDTLPDEATPTSAPKPDHHLVVVHPFDGYRRGDPITDAKAIAALQPHHLSHHCRKVFPK